MKAISLAYIYAVLVFNSAYEAEHVIDQKDKKFSKTSLKIK